MSKFVARLAREPVMLGELIKQAISLGVAFGLALTIEQMATLYGFVSLLGAFVVRLFVSPGGRDEGPKDPPQAPPSDPPPTTRPSGRPPLVPPPIAAMLCCFFLVAPALPACSSGQSPQAQAAQARTVARAGYAAAAIALVTLSDVHYAWQTAQKEPTQAVIDLDAKILFALDAAKDALEAAKPWLDRGVAGDPAKEKILEALDMAALAASVLAGTGTKVPPEVTEALEAARMLLGGAS